MMKHSVLMLLVGFAVVAGTLRGAEPPLPHEVEGYYRDFNELTLRQLQPPKHGWTSTQAFTLQSPSPEENLVQILRQRLLARRLKIDPGFNQGAPLRSPHEQVYLRVTSVRAAGKLMAVECAIYEAALPQPGVSGDLQTETAVAALDFTRMRLLRRETHQWWQTGGEWMLHGIVQRLSDAAGRLQ